MVIVIRPSVHSVSPSARQPASPVSPSARQPRQPVTSQRERLARADQRRDRAALAERDLVTQIISPNWSTTNTRPAVASFTSGSRTPAPRRNRCQRRHIHQRAPRRCSRSSSLNCENHSQLRLPTPSNPASRSPAENHCCVSSRIDHAPACQKPATNSEQNKPNRLGSRSGSHVYQNILI
jgi:hypothetical protein